MELNVVIVEIENIYKMVERGASNANIWDKLKSLECRKRQILLIQETTWRLKSKALWLREGDINTKYFHRCANQRKIQNGKFRDMTRM